MEKNEIDQILKFIERIESEDLSFTVKEKDGTNIIQRLTASELISVIQECTVAVREADKLNFLYSCSRYFIHNTSQQLVDVYQILQKLIQSFESKNSTNIEMWALFFQSYVLQTGIYSLLVKNEKPEVISEVKKLRTENKNLNKELRINLLKAKEFKEDFEKLRDEIEIFKSSKEKELTQITNNLSSTNQTKSQIEETSSSISKIKSVIDKNLSEVQASIKSYTSQIDKHRKQIEETENKITEDEKRTSELIEANSKESEKLKKLSEEATNIQKQLEKLLTPAIARDLQSTFKKRKVWLFRSTVVWLIITILLTIFLAIYIYNLFSNGEFSFDLEKVIVAGIKLLPIITILYFSIRQFTKTRALEEEYAFKESIATSLMAYAEQIKGDANRKDQLIQETVNKLYESPTSSSKTLSTGSRTKADSYLKELIELVKEIKDSK
jgi:hypothetical protein